MDAFGHAVRQQRSPVRADVGAACSDREQPVPSSDDEGAEPASRIRPGHAASPAMTPRSSCSGITSTPGAKG